MTQDVSPFCQYSDLVVMVRVALQLDSATALTAISIAARPQASLLYERFAVRPRLPPLLDCFLIFVFLSSFVRDLISLLFCLFIPCRPPFASAKFGGLGGLFLLVCLFPRIECGLLASIIAGYHPALPSRAAQRSG